MNESYSYDAARNITVKGTASYGYDALYRLSHENSTAGLYDYDYDAIGNRLTGNENGSSRSYNYPPDSSKLSAIDAAGNIIADAERSYIIDAAGRVRDVSISGTVTGSYGYAVNNLRTRKTTGGNTTHYVYGLNGLLHGEYDASGNLIREYVYLNGEPLAQVNAGETVVYLHTDHLGTPRVASDSSAAKIWEWKSDAVGTASVNIRFPGQYYDDESGLHYNWNRYYDPRTGRYITSDPIGLAGGLNLYGYVEANPTNLIDPSGTTSRKDWRFITCLVLGLCNFKEPPLKHPSLDLPPAQHQPVSGNQSPEWSPKNPKPGQVRPLQCEPKAPVTQQPPPTPTIGEPEKPWILRKIPRYRLFIKDLMLIIPRIPIFIFPGQECMMTGVCNDEIA